MPWNSLPNLAHEQLVTETHLDQIRENIEWLGALKKNTVALSGLVAAADLVEPDYDSGWFSVAINTTYTKAHGLASTPRSIELWWSSTNSPTGATLLSPVDVNDGVTTSNASLQADATNVTVKTGSSNTLVSALEGSETAGYYRLYVWK